VIPAVVCVVLLVVWVRDPEKPADDAKANGKRLRWSSIRELPLQYWLIVLIGAVFTLARFSEAFLVLRAQQSGLTLALIPLVMVAMNVVYALSAYPFGALADRVSHRSLLALSLLLLIAADLLLASSSALPALLGGVALWGLHMGMSQGLLAAMVADVAPSELRGTAYGFFNLLSGVAMLVASVAAGLLWETLGAPATFLAGALISVVTLALLSLRKA
jgi:MFS family permease